MQIIKRNDDNNTVYTPLRSVFDDFFRFPFVDDSFFSTNMFRGVSADVWEDIDNVYVKMAVPGVKEEDLKIKVDNEMISISGKISSKEEKSEANKKYYFRNMISSFEQSFNLPSKVDTNKASAKLSDGVVTITLPKSEEQKAKEIKISR